MLFVLGRLAGARGQLLVSTFWTALLDAPVETLYELAAVASQRGRKEPPVFSLLIFVREVPSTPRIGFQPGRARWRPASGAT